MYYSRYFCINLPRITKTNNQLIMKTIIQKFAAVAMALLMAGTASANDWKDHHGRSGRYSLRKLQGHARAFRPDRHQAQLLRDSWRPHLASMAREPLFFRSEIIQMIKENRCGINVAPIFNSVFTIVYD